MLQKLDPIGNIVTQTDAPVVCSVVTASLRPQSGAEEHVPKCTQILVVMRYLYIVKQKRCLLFDTQ